MVVLEVIAIVKLAGKSRSLGRVLIEEVDTSQMTKNSIKTMNNIKILSK